MKHVSTFFMKRRIFLAFILFFIVMVVIIVRLGYVQFVLSEEITERAVDSWLRDIAFQADRGNILDVNGKELTQNISAPSVIIIPRQIEDKKRLPSI